MGNALLQFPKQAKRSLGASAGKAASGEEYRIAPFRQTIPGKKRRNPASLIAEDDLVLRSLEISTIHITATTFHKDPRRIKLFRADSATETAQAAFIGKPLMLGSSEIKGGNHGLRRSVTGKKSAGFHTGTALVTALTHLLQILGKRCFHHHYLASAAEWSLSIPSIRISIRNLRNRRTRSCNRHHHREAGWWS
jgi:hypothetical protein